MGVRSESALTITIDFRYRGVRCRERLKLKPNKANMAYALRLEQKIIEDIEKNQFDYAHYFPDSKRARVFGDTSRIITIEEILTTWLEESKRHLKTSTWKNYCKLVNFQLIPQLGDLSLNDFKRRHVKDWLKTKNVSAKTLGNLISPLRCALDDAVEDELIDTNPLAGFKIKRRTTRPSSYEVDPFSMDEQTAILGELQGQARNLVQFAFWTGLRTSELIALDWDDVDWIAGTIHINKALTQLASESESPKTAAGYRVVTLLTPALEALEDQKQYTYKRGKEIFQNPKKNKRWDGDQPIRRCLWIPALKRAEVRYRRPYQTRHTFASMLLSAGEPVMWVAQQMGHTDWSMTARRYARFMESDHRNPGQKAVALFNTAKNVSTT